MLGILHIRRTRREDDVKLAYRVKTRLQQDLQDYLHNSTSSPRKPDGQEIEWDSESSAVDKECYIIIQSNDSSTTLGRGGPTESVRNFLKNFRKVPRANCMMSLETWEENRSSPTSTHRKQTMQCHAFLLQCLRGKIHVHKKNASAIQPKGDINMMNAEKIDFSGHHVSPSSIKEIEIHRDPFSCSNEEKSVRIEGENETTTSRTSTVDEFLEDILQSGSRTSCPYCTDTSSCSQTLGPGDRIRLSTGDSFEFHSSGVIGTCYALQSYDDFSFYLAAHKPLITSAFLHYRNQYETQRILVEHALDLCFQTLATIRPNESSTNSFIDGQPNPHYIFPEETSADDVTQNIQSSSDAISKTQLFDIVAHLETFVERTPCSGKKVLFSESTNTQLNGSAHRKAHQRSLTEPVSKNTSISRQEIISCLDCPPQGVPRDEDELFIARYPLESQIVYYAHDESCEKPSYVNFHFWSSESRFFHFLVHFIHNETICSDVSVSGGPPMI